MAHTHVTVYLQAGGHTLGSIEVPLTLNAGDAVNGWVPLHPDTDDLIARIKRGAEAFEEAARA